MTSQENVKQFMEMCGQEVKSSPNLPDRKTLLLRAKLLFEEVSEFIDAAGLFIGINDEGELTVFDDESEEADLIALYDACIDIDYVNLGALNALGLDYTEGHNEVHRSNMSKAWADGTIHKNEFGKVIKSPDFVPPNLEKIIKNLI